LRGRRPGTTLSPARINTVMLILRQILQEAADRYDFAMPMGKLKPLKVPKSHVAPFSLEEAHLLINKVRADYQNYMKVRIFTGMRSGELHGLKWKYIDFERRLILVREAIVAGEEDDTKSESSQRDIQMSQVVFDALKAQHKATGHMTYVFCNRAGEPIDTMNFTKRVWYPLLRHLNLAARRPYQTRHTAATLWLASGETPEWIARQLGHASTEMLFRVYSRFVPNLTRNDGSAFDRLLTARFQPGAPADGGAKGASNGDGDPKAQPPPARRAALAAA
jgi:integrase